MGLSYIYCVGNLYDLPRHQAHFLLRNVAMGIEPTSGHYNRKINCCVFPKYTIRPPLLRPHQIRLSGSLFVFIIKKVSRCVNPGNLLGPRILI
jgi:hypothetical protein